MELWDIYDKNRQLTGRTMLRGAKKAAGEYHLVVIVAVINSQGQMLMQLRHPSRELWPLKWDISAGGSALAGESSPQGACRELFEEIGIEADFSQKLPYISVWSPDNQVIYDYYVLHMDVDISTLKLCNEEVSEVKWMHKDEVLRLIQIGEIPPIKPNLTLIDMLFGG